MFNCARSSYSVNCCLFTLGKNKQITIAHFNRSFQFVSFVYFSMDSLDKTCHFIIISKWNDCEITAWNDNSLYETIWNEEYQCKTHISFSFHWWNENFETEMKYESYMKWQWNVWPPLVSHRFIINSWTFQGHFNVFSFQTVISNHFKHADRGEMFVSVGAFIFYWFLICY